MDTSKIILNELKEIKEIARENYRALRGSNGDAGLVADIEIIKVEIKNNQDKIKEVADSRRWATRAIIAAVLTVIGGIVLNFV